MRGCTHGKALGAGFVLLNVKPVSSRFTVSTRSRMCTGSWIDASEKTKNHQYSPWRPASQRLGSQSQVWPIERSTGRGPGTSESYGPDVATSVHGARVPNPSAPSDGSTGNSAGTVRQRRMRNSCLRKLLTCLQGIDTGEQVEIKG